MREFWPRFFWNSKGEHIYKESDAWSKKLLFDFFSCLNLLKMVWLWLNYKTVRTCLPILWFAKETIISHDEKCFQSTVFWMIKKSEKLSISKCVEFVYFVICLLQQFKYLYDFIAISLLTRCMSINIFLSPTIQLCTNKRDCGEPKTQSKDFPLFSLIFLNVQWPYGSLIFNIFATSTSISSIWKVLEYLVPEIDWPLE